MPEPGEGYIHCEIIAGRVQKKESSAYPLKIISPVAECNVISVDNSSSTEGKLLPTVSYILSYGGGIVHGDHINAKIHTGSGIAQLLLTQGSTKVYRHRPERPPSYLTNTKNLNLDTNQTYQTITIEVGPGALVCLLPDPVTCFHDARYNQRQVVRLHDKSSSLVLLDWMTSGRMSRGERWDFKKYLSVNIVCLDNETLGKEFEKTWSATDWVKDSRIIIRDALLLEDSPLFETEPQEMMKDGNKPKRSFSRKLDKFDAFAYLLVLGPHVAAISDMFRSEHNEQRIKPFRPNNIKVVADEELIKWSVSEVEEHGVKGVAVRMAGPNTDDLRMWIKRRLSILQGIVGDSAWSMYYNA